jgi:nucleoside-diphosphate-sugar epimerase
VATALFVAGLSGQVGSALLERLPPGFPPLLALSRTPPDPRPGVQWLPGSLEASDCPPGIDCMLSLGPLDAFAEWLQRNEGARPMRVVALGSTGARHKRDSPDPADREEARRLAEGEQRLFALGRERGAAVTVLRPTLIYGSGRDSLSRLAARARRSRLLPLPSDARGLRQPVHVQDVAAALLHCLEAAASHGRGFDLPGGEVLPFDEMVRRHLTVHAPGARLVRLPPALFALAGGAARLAGRGNGLRGWLARASRDQLADPAEAHAAFGYAPRPFTP